MRGKIYAVSMFDIKKKKMNMNMKRKRKSEIIFLINILYSIPKETQVLFTME